MGRRGLPYWTCRRQRKGVKCLTRNPNRVQKCVGCGAAKPRKSLPKHMAALNESYEFFIEINGGEHCGICGVTRAQTKNPSRRLNKDHVHSTGDLGGPRGLLCTNDNLKLAYWMTEEWLMAALTYVQRHRLRMESLTEEAEVA